LAVRLNGIELAFLRSARIAHWLEKAVRRILKNSRLEPLDLARLQKNKSNEITHPHPTQPRQRRNHPHKYKVLRQAWQVGQPVCSDSND